jgi:GT2 family glycosyltransferase
MFLSVVIPTYSLLEDCIKSLSPDFQQPKCEYEVIVSDDKRVSLTQQLLEEKYPWAQWVEGPHRGVAANRNNGVKHTKGDWIVFIDNDCIPDNNLINNYVKAIQSNPSVLVFEGCIKPNRPRRHFLEEAPINMTGGFFWTCNVMIQKDFFTNTLRGFDENFYMYAEDVDIRERIKQTNQPILFLQNAFVIHPWRMNKNLIEATKQRNISIQYLFQKHPYLRPKKSCFVDLKNELRFYVKNIMLKIIPFRGRGIWTYIKAHNAINHRYDKKGQIYQNTSDSWLQFYE